MTTENFTVFANAIETRASQMSKRRLFVTNRDPDDVYAKYLESFPEGTNPIFRQRTEHDCSCCKGFIRALGNVIELDDEGRPWSIWDVGQALPPPYDVVNKELALYVTSAPIKSAFYPRQAKYGMVTTLEYVPGENTIEWDHFYADMTAAKRVPFDRASAEQGKSKQDFTNLFWSLSEIAPSAVADVLELCTNGLYRGHQHRKLLGDFAEAQTTCLRHLEAGRGDRARNHTWKLIDRPDLVGLKGSSIGTLIRDLSNGTNLDVAVRKYEAMVAPENYRRSTAAITSGMVARAVDKIRQLNLEPSLKRRFATAEDLSVRDVIFVNRSTAKVMQDELTELLSPEVVSKPKKNKGAEEISAQDFFASVLPGSDKLEVLVENHHEGNLVSLTTAMDPDSPLLFHWRSRLAWSYNGNITDSSIKQRVKRAGGDVAGFGRVSLAWKNLDDLDIHVFEPANSSRSESKGHIHYGDKHPSGYLGELDVDMNVSNPVRNAVENITWPRMNDGTYEVKVHNYTARQRVDPGFDIEIDINGYTQSLSYPKPVPHMKAVQVCNFTLHDGEVSSLVPGKGIQVGQSATASRGIWGVKTNEFQEVSTVVLSPNHWSDEGAGNKHWFFIIRGCINPDPTRGIYNEFLHSALHEHRKVFEVLGDKTMCEPTDHPDNQLSGLGFSSTLRKELTARVARNSETRTYKVKF